MNWFYVDGGRKIGPLSEADFEKLVQEGKITNETLVWNEIISKWQPYGNLQAGKPAEGFSEKTQQLFSVGASKNAYSEKTEPNIAYCAECGRAFREEDMVPYGSVRVCGACKPIFFQKIREGIDFQAGFVYAGFWIRFLAKFVDGLIVGVINFMIQIVISFIFFGAFSMQKGQEFSPLIFIGYAVMYILQIAVSAAYDMFFVGKYGATPGKMACGLKIITADGGKVSYLRALGRHFAEWISGCLTLCIGYIMVAFDDEKRALHDRICNTRVIRT